VAHTIISLKHLPGVILYHQNSVYVTVSVTQVTMVAMYLLHTAAMLHGHAALKANMKTV